MVTAHSLKRNTSRISELVHRFEEIPQDGTQKTSMKTGKVRDKQGRTPTFNKITIVITEGKKQKS